MWISEEIAAELGKGGVRMVLLYRIAAVPVVRAWTGLGDLELAEDDVETTDGALYKGVGMIAALPEIEILLNMTMGRVALALSGVSAAVAELVEAEAADIERRPVNIAVLFLNARQQPVGPPLWLLDGVVEEIFTEDVRGRRTAGLQVGYGAVERRVNPMSYLSPADQEARHPGDTFCARTPLYDAGRDIVWPTW